MRGASSRDAIGQMAYRVLLMLRSTKNVTIGARRYPVVTKAIMKIDIADKLVMPSLL